jgi:hypothetical protein
MAQVLFLAPARKTFLPSTTNLELFSNCKEHYKNVCQETTALTKDSEHRTKEPFCVVVSFSSFVSNSSLKLVLKMDAPKHNTTFPEAVSENFTTTLLKVWT